MREIKFRARYRDTGKIIDDFMIDESTEALNSDALFVDQYTGLRDSKGVEIYEGDLLTIDDYILMSPYQVKFEDAAFVVESLSDLSAPRRPLGSFSQPMRIIGNVWENGGLLK